MNSRTLKWFGLAAGLAVVIGASLLLGRRGADFTRVFAFAAPRPQAAAPSACGSQRDFLVRSDPLLAPVQPADCSTLTQNPPEFAWPPQPSSPAYEVTLAYPDGREELAEVGTHWLIWNKVVPPGNYTWKVKVKGGGEVGMPRKFTLAADAATFNPPGADAALARATAASRPRTWSVGAASPVRAAKSERARGFASLVQEVEDKMDLPAQPEPKAGSVAANYDDTVSEQKRTLAAAYAFAVTRDPRFGRDAARRLMAQAAWSATGPISFANNDMASRNVAWTLALGYDWIHDYLSASQKERILEAIRIRTADMYKRYVASGDIAKNPYDSHGNLTLTITAAIGLLVAGDIPEADDWVRNALRMAIVLTSPWGGNDGGFANGTTQAQWDTGSNLLAWYVFKNAAGVEMERKEWVRNHARYLAYFVPPGTPSNLFGDGQEQKLEELQARTAKALVAFAPSPIGQWYAGQLNGEDTGRLELLLAPRVQAAGAPLPDNTPSSAYFPSIGWVAMHSSLVDPSRTSVYFKSSPYGSYNHSHGDQNAFVVNDKGKRLAISSGYYDGYGTPHWKEWYKQTRSSNAITFDGGQGQGFNEKQFGGEITRYEARDGYTVTTGEASRAYGDALARAQRTMFYVRPGLVLVRDVLASDTPRTWEWNIHALKKIDKRSDQQVLLRNGDATMCVEMLAGPPVTFDQTDRFSAAPQQSSMNPDTPAEWHGVFATKAKSKSAEFIALMRVGGDCSQGGASAMPIDGGWQVNAAGRKLKLTGAGIAID